jgi:hypothetical protein
MIILNWLVLGPFELTGPSGARDATISNAVATDMIGEASITPIAGGLSAGKTWLKLSQPYPDLSIVQSEGVSNFAYDEVSKTYLPGLALNNVLPGSFKITALSDTDVRLQHSTGNVYTGKVVDAIHISGTRPKGATMDKYGAHSDDPRAIEAYRILYEASLATSTLWDGYEYIDMTKYMNPVDRAVYYAYVNVYSPTSQSARLLIRSDDDCKVWLNHSKVYGTDIVTGFAGRGISAAVDKTNVTLNAGWNTLLVKIVNSGGTTGFAVCLADTLDAPLTNLIYSTDAVNTNTTTDTTSTLLTNNTNDADLIAFLNSQPSSSLGSTWKAGMTVSEYMATLSPADRAAVTQAMYSGNAALPPAPQSDVLANATDSLVSKGWGVTAQMVFWAAVGVAVILAAIFLL